MYVSFSFPDPLLDTHVQYIHTTVQIAILFSPRLRQTGFYVRTRHPEKGIVGNSIVPFAANELSGNVPKSNMQETFHE